MKLFQNLNLDVRDWLVKACSLYVVLLFSVFAAYADGSKDLYPAGVKGARAWLRASTSVTGNYPFPNLGTHYVYAKVGETIALASSANGADNSNNGRLRLYKRNANGTETLVIGTSGNSDPARDGYQTVRSGDYIGRIPNRAAEKLGPRLPGASAGGGVRSVILRSRG